MFMILVLLIANAYEVGRLVILVSIDQFSRVGHNHGQQIQAVYGCVSFAGYAKQAVSACSTTSFSISITSYITLILVIAEVIQFYKPAVCMLSSPKTRKFYDEFNIVQNEAEVTSKVS